MSQEDTERGACVLCEAELAGPAPGLEHVIPESLGGRKRTANVLCRDCNSSTGHDRDAQLAKHLLPFAPDGLSPWPSVGARTAPNKGWLRQRTDIEGWIPRRIRTSAEPDPAGWGQMRDDRFGTEQEAHRAGNQAPGQGGRAAGRQGGRVHPRHSARRDGDPNHVLGDRGRRRGRSVRFLAEMHVDGQRPGRFQSSGHEGGAGASPGQRTRSTDALPNSQIEHSAVRPGAGPFLAALHARRIGRGSARDLGLHGVPDRT